jgi:lipopolysaccharide export system protein LptA
MFSGSVVFGQSGNERLQLVHADLLSSETIGGITVQKAEGNVEFRQGETTIKCDVATQLRQKQVIILAGDVHIFDSERSLTADSVYVYEAEKKQIAVGEVVNTRGDQITRAERIIYYDAENRAVFEDDVILENTADNSFLSGGYGEFWRDDDMGQITIDPVFTQFDSMGIETSRITSDTMEVYDENNLMIARDSVVINQKNTLATCQLAEYDKRAGKIRLTGQPQVVQGNQTIAGDTLNLYIENSELTQAEIYGNAVATSEADTTSPGRWVNKMTGNKMLFFFSAEKIQSIVIEQQATSVYHVVEGELYKGANEVSGDRITIEFEDDKAQKVVVTSEPDVAAGKFIP